MEPGPDMRREGFFIGTSGYYYDDWIGLFNPPRRPRGSPPESGGEHDRLRWYQRYFPFVEINNTFYREPDIAHFLDIERRSLPSMLYAIKVHKDISHTKEFDAAEGQERINRHIAAVSPLIETGRFYSFLIQLEDHAYRTIERLDYLLAVGSEAVRRSIPVHIEFRHASWHAEAVLQSLKDAGIGVCNTDIPPVPHAFPLRAYATTDKGYLRYSGRNLANWYQKSTTGGYRGKIASRNARYDYAYSDEELSRLVTGQLALRKKTAAVAVAYNNHFQAKAVANAIKNLRLLSELLEKSKKQALPPYKKIL